MFTGSLEVENVSTNNPTTSPLAIVVSLLIDAYTVSRASVSLVSID